MNAQREPRGGTRIRPEGRPSAVLPVDEAQKALQERGVLGKTCPVKGCDYLLSSLPDGAVCTYRGWGGEEVKHRMVVPQGWVWPLGRACPRCGVPLAGTKRGRYVVLACPLQGCGWWAHTDPLEGVRYVQPAGRWNVGLDVKAKVLGALVALGGGPATLSQIADQAGLDRRRVERALARARRTQPPYVRGRRIPLLPHGWGMGYIITRRGMDYVSWIRENYPDTLDLDEESLQEAWETVERMEEAERAPRIRRYV